MTRIAILALILVAACASDAQQASDIGPSESATLREFLLDPFEDPIGHSLVLADVKDKISQRFGEPQKIDLVSKPDRLSDRNVQFSTFHYAGLVIQFAERPGQSDSWPTRIEISGDQYRLKNDLRIGTKRATVIDSLRPTNFTESPNRVTIYEDIWEERSDIRPGDVLRVDASIQLEIEFDAADRVSKIVWVYREH